MIIQNYSSCPVCGSYADLSKTGNTNYIFVECPVCGRFEVNNYEILLEDMPQDKNKLAAYLYYNGNIAQPIKTEPGNFFNFLGTKKDFGKTYAEHPYCYYVTNDIVENWYPKTFSEQVDLFLLGLSKRQAFMGQEIYFSDEELYSACFVKRLHDQESSLNDQVKYFLRYLHENDFIRTNLERIQLLPKGLQRVDELQKHESSQSKNVFIAMSFAEDTNEIREAIKKAVIECGYTPRIMDEIEHNHQIVPEMLYEIKHARFLIAELTKHNNGAYFEEGYALGLGKDVIQICKHESFGEDGHFDVKQVNSILWENTEDLQKKLVARIRATID